MKTNTHSEPPSLLGEVLAELTRVIRVHQKSIEENTFRVHDDANRKLHTATINLRPLPKTGSDGMYAIYTDIENNLDRFLITLEEGKVEIIVHKSSGQIYDQGQPYFSIMKGAVYEVFCFNSENHLLLRLTWEKPIGSHSDSATKLIETENPFREREWISIDIDLLEQSLWFKQE